MLTRYLWDNEVHSQHSQVGLNLNIPCNFFWLGSLYRSPISIYPLNMLFSYFRRWPKWTLGWASCFILWQSIHNCFLGHGTCLRSGLIGQSLLKSRIRESYNPRRCNNETSVRWLHHLWFGASSPYPMTPRRNPNLPYISRIHNKLFVGHQYVYTNALLPVVLLSGLEAFCCTSRNLATSEDATALIEWISLF